MVAVGVVGSRFFSDYDLLCSVLDDIPISSIISGGASGADSLAAQYAASNSLPLTVFQADWSRFGRSAGPRRNRLIVDSSSHLVAFWDGRSRGTLSSLKLAASAGIQRTIVNFRTGVIRTLPR